MKGQYNLFLDLPPPADKPLKFSPLYRPIWTENKARFIERYLFYFVMVTKHGAYIDGFAGPQYAGKDGAWAAKLVLESRPALLRNFWLCELNKTSLVALNNLVADQPKIRGRKIKVVPGDFNSNVASILADGGIADKTATFCLLDQRMFECEWQTLVTLAQHRANYKIELFYFLATGWIDRSISALKNDGVLQRWWGRSDYLKLRQVSPFDRRQMFIGRMKDELGYKHVYAFPIYSKKDGGRVLYHMIHASDHDEAPKLMFRAYRNALSDREELKKLQHDLAEIWGNSGSGEKPIR